MPTTDYIYKGKEIDVREEGSHAVVSVDGREFSCHLMKPENERGLAMWMCDEAYFASPDLNELARHFADYAYMFDDPGRVVVDEEGKVVDRAGADPAAAKKAAAKKAPAKKAPAKKAPAKKAAGGSGRGGH